jgi:hypothetical protein
MPHTLRVEVECLGKKRAPPSRAPRLAVRSRPSSRHRGGVTDAGERVDHHEAALLADEDVLVLDSGVGRTVHQLQEEEVS